MMEEQRVSKEFQALFDEFPRYRQSAWALESPNEDDDQYSRAAIVGFSRHCEPGEWARGHFEFIRDYRRGDYSEESLEVLHGEHAGDYALFACLCLGAMLGLFQSGQISDEEFRIGEAQLPGFMALNAGRLPA
jgi:hypothetical protein